MLLSLPSSLFLPTAAPVFSLSSGPLSPSVPHPFHHISSSAPLPFPFPTTFLHFFVFFSLHLHPLPQHPPFFRLLLSSSPSSSPTPLIPQHWHPPAPISSPLSGTGSDRSPVSPHPPVPALFGPRRLLTSRASFGQIDRTNDGRMKGLCSVKQYRTKALYSVMFGRTMSKGESVPKKEALG